MKLKLLTLSLLALLAGTLQAKPIVDRPKNRVGLGFQTGYGFQNTDMVSFDTGGYSTISFGGPTAMTLNLGREFSPHFDLSARIGYYISMLTPILKNADITFISSRISITPAYIIQIKDGSRMRVKVGAGMDLSWANELTIETADLLDGFNETWQYDRAIGYHINAKYEINATRKFMFSGGFQYDSMSYEFVSGSHYYPTKSELRSPDGQGISVVLGVNYCF